MTKTIQSEKPPLISIVLPTDTIATLSPVLDCLDRLALDDKLEVVIVIPESETGVIRLDNARIVRVRSLYPLSSARATGIRAATAPFVFIGETHSFPRPGMFEALLDAHGKGHDVVVPVFENANPAGVVSWAGFLNGYAEWTEGASARALSYAPLFNVSYRRSFLTGLGPALEDALTSGGDMMGLLRAAGCSVWIEPRARIRHWNISRVRDWLPQRFAAGRVIASLRSTQWSPSRRLAFTLGAPLIPFVLLARIRRGVARAIRNNGLSIGVLPTIAMGMMVQSVGEMVGYAAGQSESASRRYDEYEVHQLSYGGFQSPDTE